MLDPLEKEEPLPEDIEATMELLREGIALDSLVVLRQHMDDTGPQVVYDLVLARMTPSEDVQFLAIARLMPQLLDDTATKSAPEPIH